MAKPTSRYTETVKAFIAGNHALPDLKSPTERTKEYYLALGAFVTMYANTEKAMHIALCHYAKTPDPIAKSIFSGTRVREGSSFIRRICEATEIGQDIKDDLTELFARLNDITDKRDKILHYGAKGIETGKGIVTNAIRAHLPGTIQEFPISPAILSDMTDDLKKIGLSLYVRHSGFTPPASRASEIAEALRVPWHGKYARKPQRAPQKS